MASGIFPDIWNKSNTAPVNKKRKKKQLLSFVLQGQFLKEFFLIQYSSIIMKIIWKPGVWPSDSCEYLSTLIVHDKDF